jgi:DNA polymerase III subunit delta'
VAEAYPWQDNLWQQMAGRAQHAHAYLLHGPAGIGKRALAERLMASLLCKQPVGLEACGVCKSCSLLAAGSHPDNYILEPEEADKAIKVDQVRELVSFVVQTAQLGGRKVVLVEPVEAMNINAANALLKSLEEPSGNTILLLVSHQSSRLLPTIRSRCVQQACPLPSEALSLEWLASALPDLGEAERVELLTLAAGSPWWRSSCRPRVCASSAQRWWRASRSCSSASCRPVSWLKAGKLFRCCCCLTGSATGRA